MSLSFLLTVSKCRVLCSLTLPSTLSPERSVIISFNDYISIFYEGIMQALALWEACYIAIHHPDLSEMVNYSRQVFISHFTRELIHRDRCYLTNYPQQTQGTLIKHLIGITERSHVLVSFILLFKYHLMYPLSFSKHLRLKMSCCQAADVSDPGLGTRDWYLSVRYWHLARVLGAILVSCPERVLSALCEARARVGNPWQ